ncbi:hypothetical protein HK099_007961 [Clydaea vesicula]|uniref:Alkylglycerol monooxygenase n=1 Tax=Clydaea vesicula TaxID=447962 RepID=A0AAD5TYD8_9FUNG|nr:hypothetical protein HK099_007961 [Clydaea vesicula]
MNTSSADALSSARYVIEGYGRLLYIADPSTHMFDKFNDVPNYITMAVPFFISTIVFEALLMWIANYREMRLQNGRKVKNFRLNDTISSISAGMFQQLTKLLFKSVEFGAYIYIFENYAIFSSYFPVRSYVTWAFAFFFVDFGYYWFHRAAHEVNLFWAAHVVHHSSQEYNQTTALRQSFLQEHFSWLFYLPVALFGIPPSIFRVHRDLDTLFQYWIHTELIGNLGPLEYFLNTPSHHRVHHGRNPYCIDQNYAGTLIIWDRMFGTFTAEKEDEPVLYGIVHPLQSFNPFTVQTHHLLHVMEKTWKSKGVVNKFKALFYGPGWTPEKPELRLGEIKDIPPVQNLKKDPDAEIKDLYNPVIPLIVNFYVLLHFAVIIAVQNMVMVRIDSAEAYTLNPVLPFIAAFLYFSMTSIGMILDGKKQGIILECIRVAAIPFLCRFLELNESLIIFIDIFSISSFLFSLYGFSLFSIKQGSDILEPKLKTL